MGCVQSVSEDDGTSRAIDRQLERERRVLRSVRGESFFPAELDLSTVDSKTITIFLAGTGESGKSTVVKQLRLKVGRRNEDGHRH